MFYSDSLRSLSPLVAIQSASGSSCTASGAQCRVIGNIGPSSGAPPPFGLQGYTFRQGDSILLNDPDGVDIDGTWTVSCEVLLDSRFCHTILLDSSRTLSSNVFLGRWTR